METDDPSNSVKTPYSWRIVPIHPFVADTLNLRGYIKYQRKAGVSRLFNELKYQNDNYGHSATKWFGTFRRRIGITSKKQAYHSFRHTLTDNLKQQLINDTLVDELTGHTVQGESMGRYGKKYRPDILFNEAVMKLDYKEVKLDHLKNSKYAKY